MENLNTSVDTEGTRYADKIVVATNCLYRNYHNLSAGEQRNPSDTDGIRGDLALELVSKTISVGVRMVICDGGSSFEFLSTLQMFTDKGLTIVGSNTPGRGSQRRSTFAAAFMLPGNRATIYTQAEKVSLVIPQIKYFERITEPIFQGYADIVIPKRNAELFKTSYPPYMRESELRVNKPL